MSQLKVDKAAGAKVESDGELARTISETARRQTGPEENNNNRVDSSSCKSKLLDSKPMTEKKENGAISGGGGGGHFSDQQHLDDECERLLCNAKKQVKQMMEEAVTKKFIHEESSSIISLCVAIDACLSHQLKRRALGLFKTNSSTALVQKIAKVCPDARQIIDMVDEMERRQQEELKQQRKQSSSQHQQPQDAAQAGSHQAGAANNQPIKQVASNLSVHKRNMWIKCALIEKRLVGIVEHLAENASKYYEPEALMANCLSAQLLCSLLVGPSALEFSRSITNDFYQFEEPSAEELLKRHKLSNPIACLCSRASSRRSLKARHQNQNHRNNNSTGRICPVSRSFSTSMSVGSKSNQRPVSRDMSTIRDGATSHQDLNEATRRSSRRSNTSHTSFGDSAHDQESDLQQQQQQQQQQQEQQQPPPPPQPQPQPQPQSLLVRKGSGRRRPLALHTNFRTGALVTECHHYSCQEISEHQRTRGYSFKSTSQSSDGSPLGHAHSSGLNGMNAGGDSLQATTEPSSSFSQQFGSASHCHHHQEQQSTSHLNANNSCCWSAWSPRMLHETLHQNSKSSLLYAKNNVLLETQAHGTMAGYLSLHQTSSCDLILKWIPNQLINGGQMSQATDVKRNRRRKCASVVCAEEASRAPAPEDECSSSLSSLASQGGSRGQTSERSHSLDANGRLRRWPRGGREGRLGAQRRSSSSCVSLVDSDETEQLECQVHGCQHLNGACIDSPLTHSQAIGSSYLDLVINLSVSRIVLLHCHFNGMQQTGPPTTRDCHSPARASSESADMEETLILVEADGVQRAPFRFPKGGLRWFLSCLEQGLAPTKYLEPAIRPDEDLVQAGDQPRPDPLQMLHLVDSSSAWTTNGALNMASGCDSPSALSEPADSSWASGGGGRLDVLLRRLPSLKRTSAANATKSRSADLAAGTYGTGANQQAATDPPPREATPQNDSTTQAQEQADETTPVKSSEPQNDQVFSEPQHQKRHINYVYRIVSVQQSGEWPLQTPPHSALSMASSSSSSFALLGGIYGPINQSTSTKGQQQQISSDSTANGQNNNSKFCWGLSRLALFSARNGSSSSSSFGGAGGGTIATQTEISVGQGCPTQSRLKSSLGSLTSLLRQHNSDQHSNKSTRHGVDPKDEQQQQQQQQQQEQPDQSMKRDSSSELIRIEAKLNDLKKSSTEELLALRDNSIQTLCESMRKQILARAFYGWLAHCRRMKIVRTHLMSLINEARLESVKQKELTEDDDDEEEEEEGEARLEGLTWTKWGELMATKESEDKRELARRVNELVYWGGIEDDRLRAEVWPYLLGHYEFGDSEEVRRKCDESSREDYESSARDWIKIERVIKQRDSEILAHNMAKVAKRQQRERMVAAGGKSDKVQAEPPQTEQANGFSSLTSETTDPDSADLLREDEEEDLNDEEELASSKANANENGNTSRLRLQANKASATRAKRKRRRRFRLESTGSLGSDASITDQFGNNIHRIDKDVQRCDRNFWYFKETKNLERLRNIMCSYVWKHLDVGYVQGMCDLAAPILVIFDHDELMAYNCFSQMMKRMVANFPHGQAMDQHFEHLKYLMQVLDPKLFEIFQNNGDYTHFYFCYRWLLLDFKRELAYEDVYRVWETIWSARPVATEHFVVFLALAMVRFYRDIIIENNMDFTDTIKFFNEMAEHHDAKKIIALAQDCLIELESLIKA